MNITMGADDQEFKLQVRVRWASVIGLLKALLPVITAILSFLAAPEVISLGSQLGIW